MLVTGTTTVPCSWARRCAPPCCATRSAPCCGSRTSSRSTAASRSSLKPYAIAWRRRARQPTTRTRRARCLTHNSGSRVQARQFLSPGCGRFSSLYKCERLISRTSYQASFFSRWKIETFNHLPQICVGIFRFISYQNLCEVLLIFPLNILYWWSIFLAINTFSKTNVQPIVCSCKQLYKRFLHFKNYLGTVIHCWMTLYCRCNNHDISPFLESINCWNTIFKYFIHKLFYLDFYNTATSE